MSIRHIYKVYPKKDIMGVLPNNKRIIDPIILKLNRNEFIKCMHSGTIYPVINGKESPNPILDIDYEKAGKLFDIEEFPEIQESDKEEIIEKVIEIVDEAPEKNIENEVQEVEEDSNTEEPIPESITIDKSDTEHLEEKETIIEDVSVSEDAENISNLEINKEDDNEHLNKNQSVHNYQSSSNKNKSKYNKEKLIATSTKNTNQK